MYLAGHGHSSQGRSVLDLQRQKSFTLIELLIVVAIISILAAMAIPNFLQAQIRSKVASAVTKQSMIAAALDTYYVDYEQYPFNNLLTETVVSSSEAARPSRQPLRARGFAPSPFTEREEIPEPILLDISETTGVLETTRMIPMPRGTLISEPYQSVVTTTRTVVREIPYSSEIPIRPHPWQFCSSCGTVNAQTETRCAECGRQLEPSDRYMIYNQSLNGDVLSVLTTPIAYLPTEVNKDAFNPRRGRRYGTPTTFVYVNYLQINPEGVAIPLVGRRVHYAIISYGPNTSLNYIHSYPVPQISIYDPTNGTISLGDVINFGQ